MRSVNVVFLLGNVGSDVEFRTTGDTKVAHVRFATSEPPRKDRTGHKTEVPPMWHSLTFFGRQAEIANEYVKKGDLLHVQGRIRYNVVEATDGRKQYFTEIVVDRFQMLSAHELERAPSGAPSSPFNDDDDDLPF